LLQDFRLFAVADPDPGIVGEDGENEPGEDDLGCVQVADGGSNRQSVNVASEKSAPRIDGA
jgi:hypothetical protein